MLPASIPADTLSIVERNSESRCRCGDRLEQRGNGGKTVCICEAGPSKEKRPKKKDFFTGIFVDKPKWI
jgi:hypothetical protein